MKRYELKSGVVLIDNRDIKLGIKVENPETKYMSLCYSTSDGFYISTKSCKINMDNYSEYYNEFEMMRLSLVEAINILKDTEYKQNSLCDLEGMNEYDISCLINCEDLPTYEIREILLKMRELDEINFSRLSKERIETIVEKINNEPKIEYKQNLIKFIINNKIQYMCLNCTESENAYRVITHRKLIKILKTLNFDYKKIKIKI